MRPRSLPTQQAALPETVDPQRRHLLKLLAVLGAAPVVGCGSTSAGVASGSTDGGTLTAPTDASSARWTRGGTAAMTAKDSYPNPFSAAAAACLLVATTTEGPCTTPSPPVREDVSEGWAGLPVRLAIRVVDAACAPLEGRAVRVWHTNFEGSYSGATPNSGMCLKQSDYASRNFFRGTQTTNAAGIVTFATCFPGWYRGRAVHVHVQVLDGTTSTRVSQLFFPEDVTRAIFAGHEDYRSYGQPDTSLAADNIVRAIPASDLPRHVLEVERMPDGAMLASKTIAIV